MQQIQKVTRQSHNIITFMSKSKMEGVLFFFLNRQRFMHASKLNRNSRVAFLTSTTTSIFGKKVYIAKFNSLPIMVFNFLFMSKFRHAMKASSLRVKTIPKRLLRVYAISKTTSCIDHTKNDMSGT